MTVRAIPVKSILTKSNLPVCDFSVNPYVGCEHACQYCYASFMKRFTDHPEPWGAFVDAKEWPPLRGAGRFAGQSAFIGSVTDPYQPCEEKLRRTRALLEQLAGSGMKISIQTKSDLVLRDLDLIRQFPDARVGFSVNTLDETFRAEMDRAAPIARRLAAMKTLYDAGVRTTCFISPIFPGITDPVEIVEAAKDRCNLVWLENLNLRGDYKARILAWVHARRPDLDGLYRDIYARRSRAYWTALDARMRAYAAREGMPYLRDDDTRTAPFGAPPVIVNYFFHEEVKKNAKTPSPKRP
jgi:radical SAM mobile pair protein B